MGGITDLSVELGQSYIQVERSRGVGVMVNCLIANIIMLQDKYQRRVVLSLHNIVTSLPPLDTFC